jgi:hypothetical protein
MAGSLKTVTSELAKYDLDLVAVQEVRWSNIGSQPGDHTFLYEMGMLIITWGQVFSYTKLRGRWFYIIVPNVHTTTEDESDHIKDTFYDALEGVFDKFLKYHMKILLGYYNSKVEREYIFKSALGNESLYEVGNYNDV